MDKVDGMYIGLDIGTTDHTAATLIELKNGEMTCIDERSTAAKGKKHISKETVKRLIIINLRNELNPKLEKDSVKEIAELLGWDNHEIVAALIETRRV